MRTGSRTSKPSEALLADREVVALSKEVLSEGQYAEAEELSRMLTTTKSKRQAARARLIEIVRPPPKRPLYYCQHELQFLPRWTRDALRDLGDFIDVLVKCAVYEKTGRRDIFRLSLGPAIDRFERVHSDKPELVDWLRRYNRFLYRDAKHDMRLPSGRKEHRFTSREVVLAAFVTMALADAITGMSAIAARVRNDEPM